MLELIKEKLRKAKVRGYYEFSVLKTSIISGGLCDCWCMTRNGHQIDAVSKISENNIECSGYCYGRDLIISNCYEAAKVPDKEARSDLQLLYYYCEKSCK